MPVYDTSDLHAEGFLEDVSESGIRVVGMNVSEGDERTLMIRSDEFVDVYPFVFDATCRWRETADQTGDVVAGFEITNISDGSRGELRKLISLITLGA